MSGLAKSPKTVKRQGARSPASLAMRSVGMIRKESRGLARTVPRYTEAKIMRAALNHIVGCLVLSLVVASGILAPPESAGANTAPRNCSPPAKPPFIGVTITSCQYSLRDSAADNLNYYLILDVKYRASRPVAAVRFVLTIDGARRYVVDRRQTPVRPGETVVQEFQLISPARSIKQLVCWADQAA